MLKGANQFVFSLAVAMATMPVGMGHAAEVRPAISVQRIADAITLAGIRVSPDQIEVLSPVSTSTLSAAMQVVSVRHRTADTLKAKLRCQDYRECLPFYVLVHNVDRVRENDLGVHALASPPALQNTVRGGDRATLVLESADSRMSLPVICLQSGVRGQTIRVTSLDRKRVYQAEVVAAGVLKGSL